MTLATVDIEARRIPFVDEFPVSYGSDEYSEHVFVRLVTEAGTVGYGEGTALPWFTGETTAGMQEVINRWLQPRIEGRSVAKAEAAVEEFLDVFPNAPGATAAIELALLDIRAKNAGIPVREFLGPPVNDSVDIAYILPAIEPQKAAAEAKAAGDEGFRRFKVKATGNTQADAARINSVIKAIPSDGTVRIDANAGWENYSSAMNCIDEIDDLDVIEYFEQPVAPNNTADMKQLWDETGVPVFADESVHGPGDIERLGSESLIAGCCLKLAKSGSLRRMAEMASIGRRHGIDVTVISAFGSSLDAAANLQLIAATPNLSAACEIIPNLLREDPATEPLNVEPRMKIPEGPGLGIDLREGLF